MYQANAVCYSSALCQHRIPMTWKMGTTCTALARPYTGPVSRQTLVWPSSLSIAYCAARMAVKAACTVDAAYGSLWDRMALVGVTSTSPIKCGPLHSLPWIASSPAPVAWYHTVAPECSDPEWPAPRLSRNLGPFAGCSDTIPPLPPLM